MAICRLVGLGLAITALLSACGPSVSPEAPVVITFAIPVTTTHFTQANFQSLVEAFSAANPDVEIRLRSLSIDEVREAGDLYADLLLDEAWGIDAFFAGRGVTGHLVESGRILDLQPLLEGDPGWDPDDFCSAASAPFEQGGGLWAVPTEFAPLVVFYNKDLFDQAGVAYPRPQWTRDDFLATTIALRQGLPAQDFAFAGACAASLPFVYGHGGSLLDEAGQCRVHDPPTVEALAWYLDLALLHGVMPTLARVEAYQPGLPPEQLAAFKVGLYGAGQIGEGERRAMAADGWLGMAAGWGDAALWIAPLWERGGWQQMPWDFRWGVAPLPRDVVEVAVLDSLGCFITAHSPHPREALRWIDYLTRHRVQIAGLPARRSLARSEAFRQALPPEIDGPALDALLVQVEQGRSLPLTRLTAAAPRCLGVALLAIYEGGEDVATALRMTNDQ